MEEKTNQTQSAVFNYTAPRAVRMGDVFYRVESGESVYFREPCKVCDGTGQLTVKGVTFKCPCCDAQKRSYQRKQIHRPPLSRFQNREGGGYERVETVRLQRHQILTL